MADATPKKYKRPTLLGNIKRILVNQCDIPISAYVEAGVDAVGGMLASIVSPDPKELYHAVRGHSALCDLKGFLNNMEFIPPEEDSFATRYFFRNLEQYDVATWWMFLASVAHEGLINFTSQAIRIDGCGYKENPKSGPGNFYLGAVHDTGEFNEMEFEFPAFSQFYPVFSSQVYAYAGEQFSISGSAKFTDFYNTPVPSASRIVRKSDGMVMDYDECDPYGTKPRKSSHVWYSGQSQTDTLEQYSLEWAYTGGIPLPTGQAFPNHDAHIYIYGRK